MKIVDIFEQFLEERGVFDEFIGEFHIGNDEEDPVSRLYESGPTGWVIESFDWGNSRCGMSLWCDVSGKWKEIINKILKESL